MTTAVHFRRLREEISRTPKELLNDPDMREMAQEELEGLRPKYDEALQRRAAWRCCHRDPDDQQKCGAGGARGRGRR